MTIRENPSRYCGVLVLYRCGFLGLGLNNSTILRAIRYASSKNVYYSLYNVAVVNLILSVAGNIPGYWVSVATIDTIGRKPIQMVSFIILTTLFCVIGLVTIIFRHMHSLHSTCSVSSFRTSAPTQLHSSVSNISVSDVRQNDKLT
jgi:hypothetical protein